MNPESLPWVHDGNMVLLVDQYELTMLRAYHAEGMNGRAVFSLFVRRLPAGRNYLLACGLDTVLGFLERARFADEALGYLESRGEFDAAFADWLSTLRFQGDVWAVPEGTPVFPDEPILEVEAALPEAQLVETFLMNQVHLQTVLASKAARIRTAAGNRTVVDFGLRRMHGTDAGLKSARAFYLAGIDATSNVLAGRVYGVPVAGTMAHSYVQAHDRELDAFRAFVRLYPDAVLLVDTYDTLEGVRNVIRLSEELGEEFRVRAVRLDSGDLGALAFRTRELLDEAGLQSVNIFASGDLDEWSIRDLLSKGTPIDGFGVGTEMGVAQDAPALDIAYKLTSYEGRGRLKLSEGKPALPGRKQVFRMMERGKAVRDILGTASESQPGRPLLVKVMEGGRRLPAGEIGLDALRQRTRDERSTLPDRILALEEARPSYRVDLSEELASAQREAVGRIAGVDRHEGGTNG